MEDNPGKAVDLTVRLGGLSLPNPVMNASGTGGYGTEGLQHLKPEKLGAFVTKGLSLDPRAGNPPPRIVETPAGMLNAIGLENIGIDAFVRTHLPILRHRGARVVVNFFGETEDEYVEAAARISRQEGIHALEANVSCPNIRKGGRSFGRDPEVLYRLVGSLRGATDLTLWVKLTPDAVDILEVAQACWEAGCEALTVANTYMGLAVDVKKKTPKLSIGTGGLSGPAIRPLTLYRVWQVARASPVPVIGVGGISTAQDALEYLIAGAAAVQVGTGTFVHPNASSEIIEGIRGYLLDEGIGLVEVITSSLCGMPGDDASCRMHSD